ncbi:DNA-3-methyladenine glycosylase [Clostridiales bacterium CHKCI001]|nr:DNA-3-methyladenine glycosylase [Clostridiales bacterium CHKCI001]
MIKEVIPYMDLKQICYSGQCFRMNELEANKYELIALGRYLEIEQNGEEFFFSCDEKEFESIWADYFDLKTDYEGIMNHIEKEDNYLREAAKLGRGIRILRQDLWEMIITFIISQQNNIPRIRKCINLICEQYGEEKKTDKEKRYYDFPTPEALANASEEELKACNLGYRSRYIKRTAWSVVHNEICLPELYTMNHTDAKKALLKLYGVGNKVADCICLFALHHVEAFPIDTHIQQVLNREYPNGFNLEHYKEYAGILQQYMFHYEINKDK